MSWVGCVGDSGGVQALSSISRFRFHNYDFSVSGFQESDNQVFLCACFRAYIRQQDFGKMGVKIGNSCCRMYNGGFDFYPRWVSMIPASAIPVKSSPQGVPSPPETPFCPMSRLKTKSGDRDCPQKKFSVTWFGF